MLLAKLPPIVSGAAITYDMAVVTPIARTNMVTNPSVETATTGYTTVGAGGIARSTTYAAHGAYSLAVTPAGTATDGVYYGTVSLTSGTTYAASVDFYAPNSAGKRYRIAFATTAGVTLAEYSFVATGRWQRVSVLWAETSTTTRRVYITNAATSTAVFYIDGLQVEACETGNYWPTTYIDGDQQGLIPNESPPAYLWTGTPHASTSTRSGQTRAGGRVRRFADFGFTPSALVGLGLDPPEHDLVPFSVLDGAQYNDTRKPPRPFSIVGRFDGRSLVSLSRNRGGLARLLDRDLVARRQPLTLLITPQDECGQAIGLTGRITALYAGGLEGNHTNPVAEEAAISFTTVQDTDIQGTDAGFALTLGTLSSVTLDHVIRRSTTGVWARVGSGANFNGAVRAVAEAPNGYLYVGGDFTSAAGGVAATRIAFWDGSAWNAMGTGANGTVRAIVVAPDGIVYAAGDFTSMGGVANTSRIAYWDGSVWAPLSTGAAANEIYALARDLNGYLYAGGTFTSIGGVAADRIAYWDGAAWNAMGTGANGTVYALAMLLDGSIVATGAFTNGGGVADADRIARWSSSAWGALGTGLNGDGRALAVGADGTLYAGGDFTTAGGVTVNYIAQWNGNQWSALNGGVTTTGVSPVVGGLAFNRVDNSLYAVGTFLSMDGIVRTICIARWNGANWLPTGLEASNAMGAVTALRDGSLVLGLTSIAAGSWQQPLQTTATNRGTAATYPRIEMHFASGVAQYRPILFENITTGAVVAFDLLGFGTERITIVFDPVQLQIVSNVRGLLTGGLLPGSDAARFALQHGANVIGINIFNGPLTTVWWPEQYLTADDLVPS